jgi:hypothetical protein
MALQVMNLDGSSGNEKDNRVAAVCNFNLDLVLLLKYRASFIRYIKVALSLFAVL